MWTFSMFPLLPAGYFYFNDMHFDWYNNRPTLFPYYVLYTYSRPAEFLQRSKYSPTSSFCKLKEWVFMRGKEELQVRNVFLKAIKLWLIASIQSASFTSGSSPQSPTMQTRGVLLALCASRFPTHFLSCATPAFSPAFPTAGQLLWEEPRMKCWELLVSCKVLIRNRRYLVLAVRFYTSEQVAAAFDVVCFFPEN